VQFDYPVPIDSGGVNGVNLTQLRHEKNGWWVRVDVES